MNLHFPTAPTSIPDDLRWRILRNQPKKLIDATENLKQNEHKVFMMDTPRTNANVKDFASILSTAMIWNSNLPTYSSDNEQVDH